MARKRDQTPPPEPPPEPSEPSEPARKVLRPRAAGAKRTEPKTARKGTPPSPPPAQEQPKPTRPGAANKATPAPAAVPTPTAPSKAKKAAPKKAAPKKAAPKKAATTPKTTRPTAGKKRATKKAAAQEKPVAPAAPAVPRRARPAPAPPTSAAAEPSAAPRERRSMVPRKPSAPRTPPPSPPAATHATAPTIELARDAIRSLGSHPTARPEWPVMAEPPPEPGPPVSPAAPHRPTRPEAAPPSSPTRVTALVRDPRCLFVFWRISDADRERYRIGEVAGAPPLVLRLVDLSNEEDAPPSDESFDLTLPAGIERWYVALPAAGRRWRAQLGLIDRRGRFAKLAESDVVQTPREGPAPPPVAVGPAAAVREAVDWLLAQWSGSERTLAGETLAELLRGSAAPEGVPTGAAIPAPSRRAVRAQEGSPIPAGWAGSPAAGPLGAAAEGDFWLRVDTELIVYGAAPPGARVTMQGRPVALRPDGAFTVRFALPDGEQAIEVRAVSADGRWERRITPVVRRRTT